MKVYITGQGHMTKMAAMAINSKNLLLQNLTCLKQVAMGNTKIDCLKQVLAE